MIRLTKKVLNDTLYVTLKGKITEKEVRDFHYHFIPYLKVDEVNLVIFNCKDLKKMDYLGRLALLKLKTGFKSVNKQLILKEVSSELKEQFIGYRMRIL